MKTNRTLIMATSLLATSIIPMSHAQTAPGSALVDLELSLVTDVSGSIDNSEYALMIDGYASAFEDPTLHSAIAGGANGAIAVNVVFFASSATEGLGFTRITNASESNAFAASIRSLAEPTTIGSSTAINTGIDLAESLFASNSYTAPRQVIDVAADGSGGADPAARDAALAGETDTINAIAIDDPSGNLRNTLETNIVGGANSFAISADDFTDFQPAILQKLVNEITNSITTSGGILAAGRQAELNAHLAGFNDINSRLFRLRSGQTRPVQDRETITITPQKGGKSAKNTPVYEVPTPNRFEAYASIFYEFVDADAQTAAVPGTLAVTLPEFETEIWGGTAGIEYSVNPDFTVGAALVGSTSDTEINGGSSLESDRMGLALYASYMKSDLIGTADFYLDGLYAFSNGDLSTSRATGGGFASGDTDSDLYSIALNTGLNYQSGNWVHGPYGSLTYTDGEIDAFTETGPGAASFPSADIQSLRTQIGYQGSRTISTTKGPLVWQVRGAWENESENDAVNLGGLLLGAPESDYAVLGTGLLWQFAPQWRAIVDYQARLSSDFQNHGVMLRVGYSF